MAIDQSRSRVANLLSIPIENIKSLTQMFDNAVRFIDDMNQEELDLHYIVRPLTVACEKLLSSLHLSPRPSHTVFIEYYASTTQCSICWNETVRLLDLAILVYAGAHVDSFPEKIIGSEGKFSHIKTFLHLIQLQRQPLKCLNALLNGVKAWVFSLQPVYAQEELYV